MTIILDKNFLRKDDNYEASSVLRFDKLGKEMKIEVIVNYTCQGIEKKQSIKFKLKEDKAKNSLEEKEEKESLDSI